MRFAALAIDEMNELRTHPSFYPTKNQFRSLHVVKILKDTQTLFYQPFCFLWNLKYNNNCLGV